MTIKLEVFEIVGIFDFSPLEFNESGESFKFRVEVLRQVGKSRIFFARVYRHETLRVQPTFPLDQIHREESMADHEIIVSDDMVGRDNYRASSKAAVIRNVKKRIEEMFDYKPKSGKRNMT
jgi:hypothetical protein